MTEERPRWPDWAKFSAFVRFVILFWLCFFPVWFLAGWYCVARGIALVPALDIERQIPFIPAMVVPYISLPWMFLLPLFHGTPSDIARISRQGSVMIAVAGLIFVLLPTRVGYPAVELGEGMFEAIIRLLKGVDTVYLAAPSLHVAFAVLLITEATRNSPRGLAALYWGWLGVLVLSTLLIHQHHLLDAFAGAALAQAVRRYVR